MKSKRSARIPPIAYSGKKPLTPEQLRQAQEYWRVMGQAMKGRNNAK